MSEYDILLTVVAVAFCIWATYTDLKYGKIKNLCSIGLIYGGLVKQIVLFIMGEITLGTAISTFILGGIIAFGAYWLGILAAGDAKLYWGLTLILPTSVWGRNLSVIPYPALVMLVNMFIIYFAYVIIYTLIKHLRSHKTIPVLSMLQIKKVLQMLPSGILSLLKFMSVMICIQYISFKLKMQFGLYQFIIMLALYYAMEYLFKKFRIKKYITYPLYYLPLIVILVLNPVLLQAYWQRLLFFAVVYQFVLPIVISYGLSMDKFYFSRLVPIDQLKQGMIPGEQIVRIEADNGTEYIKKDAVTTNLYDRNVLVSPSPEGLSEEQIQELEELSGSGHFKGFGDALVIQHSIHFAPVILSGLLITIICGGPFYAFIYR